MKTSLPHFKAGLAYYRAGELDASLSEYQEAIRLNPDFPEAHHNLALVFSSLGRFEEAASELGLSLIRWYKQ